ncbi:MAG TPA: ROK family protein, partial [Acidimicrobiales bacterium]|nr:ROK family protein [Acidimicrobiales bacterium]
MRVGIDLGGTKIQGVVVDDAGTVVADAKRPSPQDGGEAIAAAIADVVERMGADGVTGIGIGAPGVIDRERGVVLKAPNLSISADVALTELVAQVTGVDDVRLDNDVNV